MFTQSVRSTPQATEIDYSEVREAAKRFTENPTKENKEKWIQKLKELNKK